MKGDLVCLDGVIGGAADFDRMLSANYLYQSIHTIEHRPLHLSAHIEMLEKSWLALHGTPIRLDSDAIRGEIARTLEANRYPKISNLLTLCVFPPDGLQLIAPAGSMLYKGYVMWHARPQATVRAYGFPTEGHSTALARISHATMSDSVRREGFEAVLRDRDGMLIDAGEYPLFGVKSGTVFTTPLSDGAADSVPRRIVYRLCELAHVECIGEAIPASEFRQFDELFYMTPQGLVSLLTCDGHIFLNLTTLRLGNVLEKLDPADYDALL